MTNIQFGPFCSLYVNNYLSAADSSSLKVQPPLPRDRRRLSTQLFGSQRFRHPRIVGLHTCICLVSFWFVPCTGLFLAKAVYMEDPSTRQILALGPSTTLCMYTEYSKHMALG